MIPRHSRLRKTFLKFVTGALSIALVSLGLCFQGHAEPIAVQSARLPLYPGKPNEKRAGALIYRGGLVLSSNNSAFGGWSDLAVSADGSEILSISDQAHWLRSRLSYDANGDLVGLDTAELAPMLNPQGQPLAGRLSDAEGLTLERANDVHGIVAVSFERDVRVWRYDLSKGFDARPTNVPIGNWVGTLRQNGQLESLTLLNPSTLLTFAETKGRSGGDILGAMESYPGGPLPTTRMLSVIPREPFAITSAATAPDGGLYLLERRASLAGGVGMELRYIGADSIREGARLEGEVLANLSYQDANIDNMEGIAVRTGPKGETLLYLMSDDNYLPIQRTLLLMFEVTKNR